MKILSITTSSNICSVCILEDTTCIKEITIDNKNTHSVNLLPMIQKLFASVNSSLNDIDLIVCDKGPRIFYWH